MPRLETFDFGDLAPANGFVGPEIQVVDEVLLARNLDRRNAEELDHEETLSDTGEK